MRVFNWGQCARRYAGAVAALQRLKSAGVLLAVVSNFDTRLRPLLRDLGVEGLFDAVMISAEVSWLRGQLRAGCNCTLWRVVIPRTL